MFNVEHLKTDCIHRSIYYLSHFRTCYWKIFISTSSSSFPLLSRVETGHWTKTVYQLVLDVLFHAVCHREMHINVHPQSINFTVKPLLNASQQSHIHLLSLKLDSIFSRFFLVYFELTSENFYMEIWEVWVLNESNRIIYRDPCWMAGSVALLDTNCYNRKQPSLHNKTLKWMLWTYLTSYLLVFAVWRPIVKNINPPSISCQ